MDNSTESVNSIFYSVHIFLSMWLEADGKNYVNSLQTVFKYPNLWPNKTGNTKDDLVPYLDEVWTQVLYQNVLSCFSQYAVLFISHHFSCVFYLLFPIIIIILQALMETNILLNNITKTLIIHLILCYK